MVGGFPTGDRAVTTPDQEVSKAAPEVAEAHPESKRAAATERGPAAAGQETCLGTLNLLDCSLMTGEELDAFTTLSTCSGASAEIAALAEIKTNFSAQCRQRNSPGGP